MALLNENFHQLQETETGLMKQNFQNYIICDREILRILKCKAYMYL